MKRLQISRRAAAWVGFGMCAVATGVMPKDDAACPQNELFELPESIGAFEFLNRQPLDPHETAILDVQRASRGVYRCMETNRPLVVTLLAGSRGALTSHDVDACYSRQTFQADVIRHRWTIPGRRDDFQFRTLRPRRIDQLALSVAYAWHTGDRWTAPQLPRFELAPYRHLQRIQVSLQHPVGRGLEAMGLLQEFLTTAVPCLESNRSSDRREPIA